MQTSKVVTMLAGVVALSGAAVAGEVSSVTPVSGADFLAKGADTVSVRFAGRTEFQYTTAGTDDGFSFRRLRLGAKAKLGSGFSAETVVDFDNDANTAAGDTDIRKAVINKQLNDIFHLSVGRDKVAFGYEETSSSSTGVYLERSAVNNYLNTPLGFGVRNGATVSADLGYGFTAAASVSDTAGDSTGGDTAYFGRLQWKNDSFVVGADYAKNNDTEGYTGYVEYSAAGFTVLGEYFDASDVTATQTIDGTAFAITDADVDGYAVRASYRMGSFEPVVRYSEFDAGTGEVEEIYAGVNYYIAPQVTILAGYSEVEVEAGGVTAKDESLTARLRLLW